MVVPPLPGKILALLGCCLGSQEAGAETRLPREFFIVHVTLGSTWGVEEPCGERSRHAQGDYYSGLSFLANNIQSAQLTLNFK